MDFSIPLLVVVGAYFFYKKKKNDKKKVTMAIMKSQLLSECIEKNNLDPDKRTKIILEATENGGLSTGDISKVEDLLFDDYLNRTLIDDMLDPKLVDKVVGIYSFLRQNTTPLHQLKLALHVWTTSWYMEKENKLQKMDYHDPSIILKKDEVILLCVDNTNSNKYKTTTSRINYSGPTASIRIAKGIRYRAGSMNVSRETKTELITEDSGPIFFTNKRLIFKGNKSNKVIDYDKIISLEITEAGLTIGRSNAQTLTYFEFNDYEFLCSVLSFAVYNDEIEIAEPNRV